MTSLCTTHTAEGAPGRLRLRVRRPTRGTAVVEVGGEVDLGTAPRLWELLSERPHGNGAKLIVDLSEVGFFGAAGVRVLQRAHLLGDETGTRFYVFPGACCSVRRLLDLCDDVTLRTLEKS
ncbi:hypothetical protein SD37_16355 [Amycolatopsis orientalis]|uniref:STAS domain-containing protein n=1 Tax=Amycolatopsis orientalis TaxID=31958 RepID=A0A193BY18_AMYOR|nr:hypothetical protein SD37_16355 [Amycolatopsis orientalis]